MEGRATDISPGSDATRVIIVSRCPGELPSGVPQRRLDPLAILFVTVSDGPEIAGLDQLDHLDFITRDVSCRTDCRRIAACASGPSRP